MLFLIIVLTVAMVLDCVILSFLVLMQLPKKEAGAGLAFGGAATDALFGAGSGNFLTKATKYSAGVFFALAIILSVLQTERAHQPGSQFMREVQQQESLPPAMAPAPAPPAGSQPGAAAPMTTPGSNNLLMPVESATNSAAPQVASPSNSAPAAK